jgi:hypothetical protein
MSATRLPQTITYWLPAGNDGGGLSFAAPVTAPARFANQIKQMTKRDGTVFTPEIIAYTNADIRNGAMIAEGDQSASPTPTAEARSVQLAIRNTTMTNLKKVAA